MAIIGQVLYNRQHHCKLHELLHEGCSTDSVQEGDDGGCFNPAAMQAGPAHGPMPRHSAGACSSWAGSVDHAAAAADADAPLASASSCAA